MTEVSFLSHLTNSALVIWTLQYLKGTRTYRRFAAWMPIEDQKVHVLMSALGAAASGMGMHGKTTGSYLLGWQIVLSIPPLWLVLHAIWDWAQQLALNQVLYAIAVQKREAAPVLTAQVTPRLAVTEPLKS